MTVIEASRPATTQSVGRPGLLVATLSMVVLTVSVLQTSVVPVLDMIGRQLEASADAVSWVVTANLLAAAAATPLIGRLVDLRNKKRVLLSVLALVLAGSLLAAITTSVPLLLLARSLQGTAFALYPVAVSILRDEVPADRLVRSIAVLSAMLGVGGSVGLVVTGLLMTPDASYHRVFWLCTVFTAVVALVAAAVVPSRRRYERASVDWLGGISLAVGLSALLLTITQGHDWGWLSPATVVTGVSGVAVLSAWWFQSNHTAHPLVSTAMLRRGPVLIANAATVLVGMGLYFSFLGRTGFVEAPAADGYGFGASVLDASVEFLLPGAVAAAVTALISGRCIERFGARAVITVGAGTGVAGFTLLIGWHSQPWQIIVAGLLTSAYTSLAYGALPILILQDVGEDETGIATSLNAIVRMVGSSLAAAMVGVLLTPAADGHAPESGFIAIFALGAVTALGAILLTARKR
jgi:MFS family permease